MARRVSWAILIVLFILAGSLQAQNQEPWPRNNPAGATGGSAQPAGPDQPVNPQLPIMQRRETPYPARQYQPQGQSGAQAAPGAQAQAFPLIEKQGPGQPNPTTDGTRSVPATAAQPAPPPFTLTPQEEAQLDRVLKAWEQKSKDISTFDCSFVRWEYDPFDPKFAKPDADPNAPSHKDLGILKYAAPDKGAFRVLKTETAEGKLEPIEDDRADHWICDGKSVFQYVPKQKQVRWTKLPPELQGKAIVDGPLPFLFGADAQKLRQRYFIRLIPSPPNSKNEVWLEAMPRFQQDAANYQKATLMLTVPDMTPKALEIVQPNGKSRTSYAFYDIVINDRLRLFQGNPFQAFTPRGWEMIEEAAPSQPQQAAPSQPPQAGPRQAGRSKTPSR